MDHGSGGLRAGSTMKLVLLLLALGALSSIECRPLLRGDMGSLTMHRAFPVVEPDPGHTRLTISREGLEVISRIEDPISVVAVIGPYRSGKSFLLNQLLSLSCNEGFGVGHLRDTKTRGIWVWGEPMRLQVGDTTTSVLFVDTEGFESIGKSNVYDDRIFALASLVSSVLIYNLPETVREADISKLSFAVELGEEFYGRVKGREDSFEPARLLWLIQRDFLEGKTVNELVRDALQLVVNPTNDKDLDQVNRIRESLVLMAENSTAFGLPQVCGHTNSLIFIAPNFLNDAELEPEYVRKRQKLKSLLQSMIKPKLVQGRTLNGKEFAQFLEQILQAVNEGEFPSAGSVLEVFNRGVIDRCMKFYNDNAKRMKLPVSEEDLEKYHEETKANVLGIFEKQRFGRRHAEVSFRTITDELNKAYAMLKVENDYLSTKQCDGLYSACEDKFEGLQGLRLPSMAKFSAGIAECNQTFEQTCKGTSKHSYQDRLHKMMSRSQTHFVESYNQRLFHWLEALSVFMILIGRFVIKFLLLEVAAWAMFVFLETYTRIFWSAEMLYFNPVWQTVVAIWETLVYNPILDVDRWIVPLLWISLIAFMLWRFRKRKRSSADERLHRA